MSAAPGLFRPPAPQNEPVKDYAPGSPEREELRVRLEQMRSDQIDIPLVVPCHRIVSADGLGSYPGLGPDYKRRMLALEGVTL